MGFIYIYIHLTIVQKVTKRYICINHGCPNRTQIIYLLYYLQRYMGHLQNIWHVQHTDTQINRNIIDDISVKHKIEQKDNISRHTQEGRTQGHI